MWAVVFISVPTRAPDVVIEQKSNSTSLVVKWSHLPKEHFPGQPVGYYISYYPAYFENDVKFVHVNFALNYTILSNLTAYTLYIINVSVESLGGIGPANTARIRTQPEGNILSRNIKIFSSTSSGTSNNQKKVPIFVLVWSINPYRNEKRAGKRILLPTWTGSHLRRSGVLRSEGRRGGGVHFSQCQEYLPTLKKG